MLRRRISQLAALIVLSVAAAAARSDPDEGKTVVYRDEYGVPHIYAPTAEAGAYAGGWAQCEDRLEELLKNYLRSLGEMAAAFGPSEVGNDVQSRLWRHYEVARRNYDRIHPDVRRHLAAYVQGINDYMAAHRSEVPAWWGERKVDVYMAVAHSRWFMWGWPAGQALADLRPAGVMPSFTADARSSNEMVLAPSRTAMRAPILVIDPHLSWWGAQRFWEFRIHAGELHGSGFNIPGGLPYVGLGHNDHVAWAMTTGGPDTADIYVLELDPKNPLRYRYDGGWKTLEPRKTTIAVRGEAAPRQLTFLDSPHGPVVARKDGRAYAAKLAYADEVQFGESFYRFNLARSVADFRRGLEMNQIMPQNVMVADTSGTIYYQRAGRVPIRPEGYDFSKPVDGSTSRTEWRGIHAASDLISIENPAQGYMQNCNIAPDVMMVGSPLTPAAARRPYLFNTADGRTSQRGARSVELLERARGVTPEQAIAIALDDRCYGYERWTAALREADARYGADRKANADYQAVLADILGWDGRSARDSRGALKFYYWRQALRASAGAAHAQLAGRLTDLMAALGKPKAAEPLSEAEQKALVEGLDAAARTMRARHGRLDAVYGDVFRVGRDDRSWPVGGGTLQDEGMATLRSIVFGPARPDHTRWGEGGQTSTQVIVLTKPVRSWTQPPIGQSDRADSAHYRDQAEKLFSPARMKPTWYRKQDLLKHVSRRTEIPYRPAAATH